MAIVELPKLKCKQCGWKWTPRKADIRQCPSCRSTYWNDKRTSKTVKKGE
jgi:predicted Zn-ribbon and HTH transcriptional regulator